jgi:hypothetical protein
VALTPPLRVQTDPTLTGPGTGIGGRVVVVVVVVVVLVVLVVVVLGGRCASGRDGRSLLQAPSATATRRAETERDHRFTGFTLATRPRPASLGLACRSYFLTMQAALVRPLAAAVTVVAHLDHEDEVWSG